MGVLDLDPLRAAREEVQGATEPYGFVFRGVKFEVDSEPPWDFALALARGDQEAAFALLLGDHFSEFQALHPSTKDLEALLEHFDEIWPDLPGEESAASGKSSRRTGAKPRPTSNASTDST